MTTTESIIAAAISDCASECEKLDRLKETASAGQKIIEGLERDLSDLRANTASLEPRVRSSRHVSGQSLLVLERADLATIESQIDAQADRVFQCNTRAITLLQQVLNAILQKRKANIEATLERDFNLAGILVTPADLANRSRSVIEVQDVLHDVSRFRAREQRDAILDDVRTLRERSTPVISWAAHELDEDDLKLVDPGLVPIWRPSKAPATLSAPMLV